MGVGENMDVLGDVCPACNGTGVESISCDSCEGQGLVDENLSLMLKIPASVDTGMLLRVREKGNQALNGKCGDFIVNVVVRSHPKYERKGYDILSNRSITVTEAIFGATVDIETIYGTK